jgi:ABC-2 type transport system permease protein
MDPDIARLTARQLLTRGRLIVLTLVAALPPLLALVLVLGGEASGAERAEDLSRLYDGLVLTTVLPVLALVVSGAALGNEVEDGTLFYLLMKPVRRWRIITAKLVVATLIVIVISAVSILLAAVIAARASDTLRVGMAFTAGATAGAIAYSAAFLYLGLITSRTLVIGLLYVFLWEGALTGLFTGLRALSIRQYARGVAEALADLPVTVFNATLSTRGALIGVVIVTAACILLAVQRLNTMDVD